jgi:hypothetical protein
MCGYAITGRGPPRAYSQSEALRWVHPNTGAHPWCPAHGALRQAARAFWQETRQHKAVLGEDDDAQPVHSPPPRARRPARVRSTRSWKQLRPCELLRRKTHRGLNLASGVVRHPPRLAGCGFISGPQTTVDTREAQHVFISEHHGMKRLGGFILLRCLCSRFAVATFAANLRTDLSDPSSWHPHRRLAALPQCSLRDAPAGQRSYDGISMSKDGTKIVVIRKSESRFMGNRFINKC